MFKFKKVLTGSLCSYRDIFVYIDVAAFYAKTRLMRHNQCQSRFNLLPKLIRTMK
ncbi:hypothetical protein PALB_7440 [Pseudoalteromonas luteoviolacea B = ATCC 29581]|nr:hypothetical protein PALB_7440 [Pseudoalteromonas luteoviolacea B = ATCC 29581]